MYIRIIRFIRFIRLKRVIGVILLSYNPAVNLAKIPDITKLPTSPRAPDCGAAGAVSVFLR
jgi:hypothetical protein